MNHQHLLIQNHYEQVNLTEYIEISFQQAEKALENHNDTAQIDGFHIRGREATRELAELAALSPESVSMWPSPSTLS